MERESELTADERRARRATWPIRRVRLEDSATSSIASTTTATERVAMMWEPAEQAWRVAGRPLPDYERSEIPGRIIRPGDAGSESDDAR